MSEKENEPSVEERQAEEFAEEMQAEPKNIDGEPGVASLEEESAAAAVAGEEAHAEPPASADQAPVTEPETTTEEPPVTEPETTTEQPPVSDPDTAVEPEQEPPSAPVSEEAAPAEAAVDAEPPIEATAPAPDSLSADEILAPDAGKEQPKWPAEDAELTAMLEAVIYITEEPLTLEQIANALEQPRDRIKRLLEDLVAEWQKPHHGLAIREVAGGYKMTTKPEHHDAVRRFVKSLKPPMKLSLPALETLAVIAYKQPVTGPEIMDIRGVQGAGVLKTLIDRKLIAPAGRKNVLGKPILYKTTKEFLVQFGLKDLTELPSVKEFEELARFATPEPAAAAAAAPAPGPTRSAPPPAPEPEPTPQPSPAEQAEASEVETSEVERDAQPEPKAE
jgi:segregation and condensation protein B